MATAMVKEQFLRVIDAYNLKIDIIDDEVIITGRAKTVELANGMKTNQVRVKFTKHGFLRVNEIQNRKSMYCVRCGTKRS